MKNISCDREHIVTIRGINFSSKELCVISLLINGRIYKEIALLFSISNRTVAYHVNNIMQKMNCGTKKEVIEFILQYGSK